MSTAIPEPRRAESGESGASDESSGAGGAGEAGGADESSGAGLLSSTYRATTVGMVALVVLYAFESLALSTAMPRIAADLHGESLYAMAFSATLAAGAVSVVVGGSLADRHGAGPPLRIGLLLFAAGLLGAAVAGSMALLVAARFLQGLGAGMTVTSLYVMVAAVFPPRLQVRVLAAFSAAWVVPSLVGPPVAGLITQTIGWRWVFWLSLVVLLVAAVLMTGPARLLVPVLRPQPWRWGAIGASLVAAAAILALNLASEGDRRWIAVVAIAVLVVAASRLLPAGTLLLRRGVPASIAMRAFAFAALAGSEVYLPRLLTDRDGYSPAVAGSILTITGVAWFVGSTIQGRWSERLDLYRTYLVSTMAALVGLAVMALLVRVDAAVWAIGAAFAPVGLGLGMVYPRITTAVLAQTPPERHGFISSAIQIGDQAGGATALAVTAIVFSAAGAGVPDGYVGVFSAMAVSAAVAVVAAARTR